MSLVMGLGSFLRSVKTEGANDLQSLAVDNGGFNFLSIADGSREHIKLVRIEC